MIGSVRSLAEAIAANTSVENNKKSTRGERMRGILHPKWKVLRTDFLHHPADKVTRLNFGGVEVWHYWH